MSCPNPSAHPVGVRHTRRPPARAERSEATRAPPSLRSSLALVDRLRAVARRRRPSPPSTRSRPASTRLYHQAEQASERYNDAKVELDELRKDLGSLQADQDRQDDRLTAVREQVQDSIVSQYEGTSLSAVGQVVVSRGPEPVPLPADDDAAYNDIQSQLFDDYATELKALDIRRAGHRRPARRGWPRLEKQLGRGEGRRSTTSSPRPRTLLGKLKAERARGAARLPQRQRPRCPSDVPASGRAGAAVQLRAGPGRRRLRLRRRRPERLRLLRPDDDGLGPGGRRPAALLERPVRLRPAHRLERPAAGRPGLLLQPDQPRRHVHRQRPDRARRQPRRRRPGRRPVLDAVRRRGPPWLILARTPM